MKKTISMYYTDVLESVEDTIIYKWLTERYTVIVDPINPDFLFYNIFGDDYKKYHGCVKTFIVNEDEAPNFNECDYAAGFVRLSYGDRYFRRVPDLCELDKSIQDSSGSAVMSMFVSLPYQYTSVRPFSDSS